MCTDAPLSGWGRVSVHKLTYRVCILGLIVLTGNPQRLTYTLYTQTLLEYPLHPKTRPFSGHKQDWCSLTFFPLCKPVKQGLCIAGSQAGILFFLQPRSQGSLLPAVTAFWASLRFGHPHSQIPSVLVIPSKKMLDFAGKSKTF